MVPSKAVFSRDGGTLKVRGKLDFAEEDELRKWGREALAEGGGVLLDLSEVTYISSSCLGEILVLDETAKKKNQKLKVRIPKALLYVYDLMGLRSVVDTEVIL